MYDETVERYLDNLRQVSGEKFALEVRKGAEILGDEMRTFSLNMETYMTTRRITSHALAERTGLSYDVVIACMQGKFKPQPETLRTLADIFKCPVDELWPKRD